MKEKIRALMILNEIEVDAARIVNSEKFAIMSSKITDVRTIILNEIFPEELSNSDKSTIDYEIDWSSVSKS